MRYQTRVILVLLLIVMLIVPQAAYSRCVISLTDSDKAQIIGSMLRQMLSISKEDRTRVILVPQKQSASICQNQEIEQVEYISTDNISESLLPKLPYIRFVLLRPDEIEKKRRIGISYLRFDKFEVKGSKVEVRLSNAQIRGRFASSSGMIYYYRKRNGKWRGKMAGSYSSIT